MNSFDCVDSTSYSKARANRVPYPPTARGTPDACA
jgi:hypothetical protein